MLALARDAVELLLAASGGRAETKLVVFAAAGTYELLPVLAPGECVLLLVALVVGLAEMNDIVLGAAGT